MSWGTSRTRVSASKKVDADQVVQVGVSSIHAGEDLSHTVEISLNGALAGSSAVCHKDFHADPLHKYFEVGGWDCDACEFGNKSDPPEEV